MQKSYHIQTESKANQKTFGIHKIDNIVINDDIKNQVINYIYESINLVDFKYKILEYEMDLPILKERKYYVSPNYNGLHGLLVFMKYLDKYVSIIVDRRTLKFYKNQINLADIKMIPVVAKVNSMIYNGSIFEGVLLYSGNNNVKNYVINDVYKLCGKSILDDTIINKMIHISALIEAESIDGGINFIINKLHNFNEIQKLMNQTIPNSKYCSSIKGLAFHPEISGTKLVYLYSNCSETEETEKPIKTNNIAVVKSDITAIFKMKKTETIDVYHLYLGEKVLKGDVKIFKYVKMGIACIPTSECSSFCKSLFGKSDACLIQCKYDIDKKKWIPYCVVQNQKRPDLAEKVERKIKLLQS